MNSAARNIKIYLLLNIYHKGYTLLLRVLIGSASVTTDKQVFKWLYKFSLPPAMHENSSCSRSSPTVAVVSLLNYNHAGTFVKGSHCSCALQFPHDGRF